MKHILMIATGGTIASRETADGLTPQLTSEAVSYTHLTLPTNDRV